MNKFKAFFPLAMSAVMLLASCGNKQPASSSAIPSSEAPASSSTPASSSSVDKTPLIEKFANALKESDDNVTVLQGGFNTYFHSSNAFFYDFDETFEKEGSVDCGYVKTSQGVFKYVLDENEKIVLQHCESVSSKYSVADLMYYPSFLVRDTVLWDEGEEDYTYTTKNTDSLAAALSLTGYTKYASYVTNPELTLSFPGKGDISEVVLSYNINGLGTVACTLTDIGETKLDFVDEFLKNPTVVANPTDYSDEIKQSIAASLGIDLPFYGASYAMTFDAKNELITDLGCGNITPEFTAALLADGWVIDAENSKTLKDSNGEDGYVLCKLSKNIYEGEKLVRIGYCSFLFVSGCYFDDYSGKDVYEDLYEKGRFNMTYSSDDVYALDEINGIAQKWAKENGFGGLVPNIALSENIHLIGADFSEQTALYDLLFTFGGTYASADKLNEDINAFASTLLDADFICYDEGKLGEDEDVLYYLNSEEKAFFFDISYKNNGSEFSISFGVGKPFSEDIEGVEVTWDEFLTGFAGIVEACPKLPSLPESLKKTDNVIFSDMTEMYQDMWGGFYGIDYAHFYLLDYGNDEDCFAFASAYASLLLEAGFNGPEEPVFDSEEGEFYTYEGTDGLMVNVSMIVQEGVLTFGYLVGRDLRAA